MPWPVSSWQTLNPLRSTSCCTAAPMSPVRAPATAAFMPASQPGARRRDEPLRARRHGADRHRDAGVGVVAVELGRDVELHELALLQPPRAGDPVDRLVVDADAGHAGEVVGQLRRGARAVAREHAGGDRVELGGRHARAHARGHRAQRLGDDAPGGLQALQLIG